MRNHTAALPRRAAQRDLAARVDRVLRDLPAGPARRWLRRLLVHGDGAWHPTGGDARRPPPGRP
jgi:hypothetical protein